MADLRILLEDYRRRHPAEGSVVDGFEEFLRTHAIAFARSCRSGHFTGSAWIVDAAGERVLLTHHRKLDRWLQPGGHADGETDLAAVALREAVEETGLSDLVLADPAIFDLDRHPIPARGREPAHHHYDVRFLVRCAGNDRYTVSDESHDLAWVPITGIRRFSHEESILRLARKTPPPEALPPAPAQR
jgi:8-oxo-dGTP pyrophosphatase MutT (NUDIX family)